MLPISSSIFSTRTPSLPHSLPPSQAPSIEWPLEPSVSPHTAYPTIALSTTSMPTTSPENLVDGPSPSPSVETRPPSDAPLLHIRGDLKRFHKITVDLHGPFADELGTPNPFIDFRYHVIFIHNASDFELSTPGYFAADGRAANTSATSGNVWRAHLRPHLIGWWSARIIFEIGHESAIDSEFSTPHAQFNGLQVNFFVSETDKFGRDLRAKGVLRVVPGSRYLQFDSGEAFLKVGADSPENLLAYSDFDGELDFLMCMRA